LKDKTGVTAAEMEFWDELQNELNIKEYWDILN
jgi:hypothetical protein